MKTAAQRPRDHGRLQRLVTTAGRSDWCGHPGTAEIVLSEAAWKQLQCTAQKGEDPLSSALPLCRIRMQPSSESR